MPPGYEMLQVGERPPNDPNFQTREVVMAAPGTVVAPLPNGMEPTMPNAMMAILMQLLQAGQPGAKRGVRGMAGGGITSSGSPAGLFSSGIDLGNLFENRRQFDVGDTRKGQQNVWQAGQNKQDRDLQYSLNARQNAMAGSLAGRGAGGTGGSSIKSSNVQRSGLNLQNSGGDDNAWRWAQLEMQKQLGNRGMDIESQLGQGGLAARRQEAANQLSMGNRGMDIQSASDAFSRIMAGVSEASLPGVRGGGTPNFGLYG